MRYTLIDLSAVESMDINYSDVSRAITQNASIATKAVPGVLFAVASPRDHGYGLAAHVGSAGGTRGMGDEGVPLSF